MKTWQMVVVVIFSVAVLAGEAGAIGAGPGGRIYMTQKFDNNASRYIELASYEIGADWNIVGVLQDHGDILDNCLGGESVNTKNLAIGLSPEIAEYGGSGYGKLVFGAMFNNGPAGVYGSGHETMDVIRVTAQDGGIATVEVLGNGRGKANNSDERGTDGGMWAFPDPEGGFTGGADRYVVNAGARYLNRAWICTDTDDDCDITDDDADYVGEVPGTGLSNAWNGYGAGNDYEIVGNKLFRASGRYGGPIQYSERYDNGEYSTIKTFNDGSTNVCVMTDYDFAAGKVQGHDAVWAASYNRAEAVYNKLALFIDLNNDGDAMDNADVTGSVDEYREIYFGTSTSHLWDNPSFIDWLDMEFIEGGDNDFLLIKSNSYGLFVLQLADNGEWAGTGQGAQANDYSFRITSGTSWANIEFDSELNVQGDIPEPATLLLLGTGVLGAIGVVRRRRMR